MLFVAKASYPPQVISFKSIHLGKPGKRKHVPMDTLRWRSWFVCHDAPNNPFLFWHPFVLTFSSRPSIDIFASSHFCLPFLLTPIFWCLSLSGIFLKLLIHWCDVMSMWSVAFDAMYWAWSVMCEAWYLMQMWSEMIWCTPDALSSHLCPPSRLSAWVLLTIAFSSDAASCSHLSAPVSWGLSTRRLLQPWYTLIRTLFYNMFLQQHYTLPQHFCLQDHHEQWRVPSMQNRCEVSQILKPTVKRAMPYVMQYAKKSVHPVWSTLPATKDNTSRKHCACDACKTCSCLKATPAMKSASMLSRCSQCFQFCSLCSVLRAVRSAALCCVYVLCDSDKVCACLSNRHLARDCEKKDRERIQEALCLQNSARTLELLLTAATLPGNAPPCAGVSGLKKLPRLQSRREPRGTTRLPGLAWTCTRSRIIARDLQSFKSLNNHPHLSSGKIRRVYRCWYDVASHLEHVWQTTRSKSTLRVFSTPFQVPWRALLGLTLLLRRNADNRNCNSSCDSLVYGHV